MPEKYVRLIVGERSTCLLLSQQIELLLEDVVSQNPAQEQKMQIEGFLKELVEIQKRLKIDQLGTLANEAEAHAEVLLMQTKLDALKIKIHEKFDFDTEKNPES